MKWFVTYNNKTIVVTKPPNMYLYVIVESAFGDVTARFPQHLTHWHHRRQCLAHLQNEPSGECPLNRCGAIEDADRCAVYIVGNTFALRLHGQLPSGNDHGLNRCVDRRKIGHHLRITVCCTINAQSACCQNARRPIEIVDPTRHWLV